MTNKKEFNKWRAGKMGYVYFSRLSDLIIHEPDLKDSFFQYLIDVGENQRQTGRLFGVEVEPYTRSSVIKKKRLTDREYINIPFPALLVMFDNKNDKGYFRWLKKPSRKGQLALEIAGNDIEPLNNDSLHKIVDEVKEWYSNRLVA